MAATAPQTDGRHGLKAFRLSDIPQPIRERAKERLLPLVSATEAVRIGMAAECPSDQVYWIGVDAWEAQARTVTWRRAEAKR